MFVLFSNHMEERLADGKSVIRLDTCSVSSKVEKEVGGIDDEHSSLLQSSHSNKVRAGGLSLEQSVGVVNVRSQFRFVHLHDWNIAHNYHLNMEHKKFMFSIIVATWV